MNEGLFKKGFDERRNLEGRPKGAKNYKTVLREYMDITISVNNPFTNQIEQISPTEALFLRLWHNALVKDEKSSQKLLLEHIKEYSDTLNDDEEEMSEAERDFRRRMKDWTPEEEDEHTQGLLDGLLERSIGVTWDSIIKHLDEILEIIGDDKDYHDIHWTRNKHKYPSFQWGVEYQSEHETYNKEE